MMNTGLAAPVDGPLPESERRPELDALRGLAIAGVLVVNSFAFAYPIFSSSPQAADVRFSGPADRIVQMAVALLLEGKFYTLLCILFGAGLMLQHRRAEARRIPFGWFCIRRLLLLFVIGMAHGILFFAGDILSFYALVALAALLFRQLSGRRLLITALSVFLLGLILAGTAGRSSVRPDWLQLNAGRGSLPGHMSAVVSLLGTTPGQLARTMAAEQDIYQSGTWLEITRLRTLSCVVVGLPSKVVYLGLYFLGLFLMGMYVAESHMLLRLEVLRRAAVPAILAGLLLEVAGVRSRPVTLIATVILAAGYAGSLVLYCSKRPQAFSVRALSALGRPALTNYLLQSVIYGALFYAPGYGLHARLSSTQVLAITPIVLVAQIAFSMIWLGRFRLGPIEWAWRCVAYSTLLPLLRHRAGAPPAAVGL